MGYQVYSDLWSFVERFQDAGLGNAVQWARWNNNGAKGPEDPTAGCYVYLDSQASLGVTVEILANAANCDRLPSPSQVSPYAWMPSVPLGNAAVTGARYPVIGLGTGGYGSPSAKEPECWWDICDDGSIAEKAIGEWLDLGGRRIDDATSYYHQKATGRALKATKVPREEIYYVSKTGPTDPLGYDDILKEAQSIRDVVGLEYVDALLVHWPTGGRKQGTMAANVSSDPLCQNNKPTYDEKGCRMSTWRGMVHLYNTGFARAIGVSNYNETHLMEIADAGMPLPSMNQIPYNPHRYKSHARMEQLCRALGIAVTGYSPFGVVDLARGGGGSRGGHSWPPSVGAATLLKEPAVLSVAAKHNASAAQVLIAWSLAVGVTVNPRTDKVEHMQDNLLAWQLNLTASDVVALSSLTEATCDVDPDWYECTPTATHCPPQCCDTPPCKTDSDGNCCAGGGQ